MSFFCCLTSLLMWVNRLQSAGFMKVLKKWCLVQISLWLNIIVPSLCSTLKCLYRTLRLYLLDSMVSDWVWVKTYSKPRRGNNKCMTLCASVEDRLDLILETRVLHMYDGCISHMVKIKSTCYSLPGSIHHDSHQACSPEGHLHTERRASPRHRQRLQGREEEEELLLVCDR